MRRVGVDCATTAVQARLNSNAISTCMHDLVAPAKAGAQCLAWALKSLGPGVRRGDELEIIMKHVPPKIYANACVRYRAHPRQTESPASRHWAWKARTAIHP